MRLHIKGGSQVHQKHCRQFARFFSKKFFTKELNKQITIRLKLTPKANIQFGDECAYVQWVDSSRHPRKFAININIPQTGASLKYVIGSLAHEMVHVKQFVKNELVDLPSTDYNVSLFKNKRYNLNRIAYYDQPWEIEAFGRERGLMGEYLETVNLTKRILVSPVDF